VSQAVDLHHSSCFQIIAAVVKGFAAGGRLTATERIAATASG